jgi:hypothetical protein
MKHHEIAPIALFVYNRPEHVSKTLNALEKNHLATHSTLYIFSDGPKKNIDKPLVSEVRNLIKKTYNFKTIKILEKSENVGLANSIVSGVNNVLNKHNSVIIVEDDIVTSPYFLTYMNDALEIYRDVDKVMHVSAYLPPVVANLPETFFFNQSSCWGWATWKRAWKHYNNNANFLLKSIEPKSIKKFNIDDSIDLYDHLTANIDGRLDTWAIKWHASIFLRSGLCLHPKKSLTLNIGRDGSGTNTGITNHYESIVSNQKIIVSPIELTESKLARFLIANYYRSINPSKNLSFINQIKRYFGN